jgi:hypothetical protein
MTAPNPQVRISPSGPLATGATDPFQEYAGAVYKANPGSPFPSNARAGRIGPSTEPANELQYVLEKVGTGVPVLASVPANRGTMTGPGTLGAPLNDFAVGAGLWLVEARVSLGFGTDLAALGSRGIVNVAASLVGDNGVDAVTVSNGSQNYVGPSQDFQTFVCPIVVEVTPAMVAANANAPLKGLNLKITRQSTTEAADGGYWGAYNANSGTLQILSDSSVVIRRLR